MKILGIVAAACFVVVAIVVIWAIGTYNQIVSLDQFVQERASQIQNVYQRRADLIENLVETVKGYAGHERGTLTDVTQARASATGIQLTPEALKDPEAMKKFQAAQGALSGALSRLMVSVERYPDLKANHNFMELQKQLVATENLSLRERQRFNMATQAYNTKVRRFPGSLLAGMFGFTVKPYFESDPGAKVVPKVNFGPKEAPKEAPKQ